MTARFGSPGRRRGSVGRLVETTYFGTLLGLVTGPMVARALDATGRGDLAAVITYAGLAAVVLGLGLPAAVGCRVASVLDDAGPFAGRCFGMPRFSWSLGERWRCRLPPVPCRTCPPQAASAAMVPVGLVSLAVVGGALQATVTARDELGTLARLRPQGEKYA